MKYSWIFLSVAACSHTNAPTVANEVTQAYEQAVKTKDYRIMAITGRMTNLPGVDIQQYSLQQISEHCGLKVIAAGDVIKDPEQKQSLAEKTKSAVWYNQKMLTHCAKNINKATTK